MEYRPLRPDETGLLELATLGNMNWCGERMSLDEVLSLSDCAHYTRIVPERGDFGVVAEDGDAVGVAWAVFLPETDAGYGFVDEATPELSLWVAEPNRGRGVGRALLRSLLDEARARGIARVSLSVEEGNYAKRLYLSEGFADVPGRESGGVMLCTL